MQLMQSSLTTRTVTASLSITSVKCILEITGISSWLIKQLETQSTITQMIYSLSHVLERFLMEIRLYLLQVHRIFDSKSIHLLNCHTSHASIRQNIKTGNQIYGATLSNPKMMKIISILYGESIPIRMLLRSIMISVWMQT